MTIYPLSSASWPAKQPAVEDPHCSHARRRDLPPPPPSWRSPRQWELRKSAIVPALDGDDYWSDASMSLTHLSAPLLPQLVGLQTPLSSQSDDAHLCPLDHIHRPPAQSVKPRRHDFPPPLDSPAHLQCEGRFSCLETVEKVRFACVRSNGRLLVSEVPVPAEPPRSLRVERRDGRLVLRLHVEEQPLEAAERVEEENPPAIDAHPMASTPSAAAQEVEEASNEATHGLEEDEGDEGGDDKGHGSKISLYTKVLKTLEYDAFSDSVESLSPIQLNRKPARGSGVASFLHKSLTRVRPLHMLSIWQA